MILADPRRRDRQPHCADSCACGRSRSSGATSRTCGHAEPIAYRRTRVKGEGNRRLPLRCGSTPSMGRSPTTTHNGHEYALGRRGCALVTTPPSSRRRGLRASSSSVTPRTTVAATAPPARSAARQFFSARGEFPQNRPLSTRGGPLLGGGGHYSLKIRRKCDLPHIRGLRRVLSSEWCSLIRSRTLRCRQRRSTGGISTCFVTAVRSAPDRNHRR
jgi:hypothetical protein